MDTRDVELVAEYGAGWKTNRTSSQGALTRRTTNDYKTFLCKEPCSAPPYTTFTNGFNIILSNLNLFDTLTGDPLLELDEGTNTLRYYSQDPAKNFNAILFMGLCIL